MSGRGKGASLLVGLGCAVLLAGAALHLIAAYPQVSAGLRGSNLNTGIQAALRAVFLLIGWDWIAIAMIVLIAAFTATRIRKPLVLICGFLPLLHAALMLAFLGWFVGSDMILASALLILCGALLLDSSGGRSVRAPWSKSRTTPPGCAEDQMEAS